MGELDALGPARRARGVEERGDVAGRGRHRPTQRLGTLELVGRPHDHVGAGIGHHVVDLVGAHLRVHRHRDAAGSADGQAEQELVVAVGGRQHDTVAGLDAGGRRAPAHRSTRSAASR